MKNLIRNFSLAFLLASCASPKISNLEKGRFRYNEIQAEDIIDVSVSKLPFTVEEAEQAKPYPPYEVRI